MVSKALERDKLSVCTESKCCILFYSFLKSQISNLVVYPVFTNIRYTFR